MWKQSSYLMKIAASKPIIAGALVILLCGIALANFQPVFNPDLEVKRIETGIKIDGDLNDPGWRNAAVARNFVETYPGDNLEPATKTDVYVTYDNDNLYVAFVCFDDPSKIRATMCQRDQFYNDDEVAIYLDTYGEAAWAYELYVNPYGIQKDYIWSSISGDDRGFDLVWSSAAKITDHGYQVEIAVPFASLRFPTKDVQSWRMNFGRDLPRDDYKQLSWAANNRDEKCWPCKWGTISGITNVQPGKGFEVLPTFVGYQSGSITDPASPATSFKNQDPDGELSVGGKYSISSNTTLEGAYNPDFSQIESDAAQIDVNRTVALFYPERRPFFQEGSDIFRTIFNAFYTRTVNDPNFAVKMTSRTSKTSVGFLTAQDQHTPYIIPLREQSILAAPGKSYVNVLRASRTLGEDNHVGFIINDRRIDGDGYGTVIGVDGDIRLSQQYSVVGQYLTTFTKEPIDSATISDYAGITFDEGRHTAALDGESFHGDGFIAQFRRRARHLNLTVDYNQVSPTYRTEVGYDPWNDYRNLSLFSNYTIYLNNKIINRLNPQFYVDNRWNYDNKRKWQHLTGAITGQFNFAQTGVGTQFTHGSENWWGTEFENLWNINVFVNSQLNDRIGYYLSYDYGVGAAVWVPAKGNETSFYASLTLKPIDRLTIEPDFNFTRNTHTQTGERFYNGYITRTRIQLQANRELSFRFVLQYNNFSDNWQFDPLLTYRLGSFSVFYVGSSYNYDNYAPSPNDPTNWRLSSRQFFMKLQYLFRT